MKALIVDDSRAIRGILGRILSRNGFTVCEAGDGLQALEAIQGEAANITLLCADFNMPEMDGIELLKAVRAMDKFKSLPCVMITTETHLETVTAALQVGAEYIMKPFTSDMVVEKLRMMGVLEAVSA